MNQHLEYTVYCDNPRFLLNAEIRLSMLQTLQPVLVVSYPDRFRFFVRFFLFATSAKVTPAPSLSSHFASCSLIPIFLLRSTLYRPMKNTVLKCFLRANIAKNNSQRGLLPGQFVHFLVEVSTEALFARSATLSNASTSGEAPFCCWLHDQDVL